MTDRSMAEREQRVTPLELFFDLVFVYALTQVTQLMANDLTGVGVGHGLLVLAALWWAWTGYAWLTNILEPEEGLVRAGVFGAMIAMLVAAIAVPSAFGAAGILFGTAFLLVRLLNLGLDAVAGRHDPGLRRWSGAGGALDRRARDLVCGRPDRSRGGLARRAGALRGAPRAHRHHRA